MKLSEAFIFIFIRQLLGFKRALLRRRFFRSAKDLFALQEKVLLKKIRRNADSEFGKRYGFEAIRSIPDFQRALPLSEYDFFEPYIERMKRGETWALLGSKERLLMFALTSGTTGSSKYIPVTRNFLEEYREGAFFWASHLAKEFKDLRNGRILPIFSPLEEERSPSGLPCGAISGLIARMQGRLIESAYAAPFEASRFAVPQERHYAFLRSAAEKNVTMIITANPSTLLSFAKTLEENTEELLQDLSEGTLRGKTAPFPLAKDPKRSEEVARIFREKGIVKPKDLWPELQVLACWKGGTLFHYLKELPEHYGSTLVKDIGLLASEGRFSFPIFPNSDEGLLDVFHHFLEFIPESEEDLDRPETLLVYELEKGKRYFMVITTSSGLYRYKLHDLIEVKDFYKGIPTIVFLNKGRHIGSLTGEKLTEHQVLTAVQNTAHRFHIQLSHFRAFPRFEPKGPHYLLVVEKGEGRIAHPGHFTEILDEELRKLNVEYAGKRLSGRLGEPVLEWAKKGVFSDRHKNSHRPEQYKPVYLSPDPEMWREFEKFFEK
jgi:hypothetical protein